MAVDATTIRDCAVSCKIRRRRRDAVSTTHSKKSIHMIGVLGEDAPDLQFHDSLSVGIHVSLVEHLRQCYGKVDIVVP